MKIHRVNLGIQVGFGYKLPNGTWRVKTINGVSNHTSVTDYGVVNKINVTW